MTYRFLLLCLSLACGIEAPAKTRIIDGFLDSGFTKIQMATPEKLKSRVIPVNKRSEMIGHTCSVVGQIFKQKYKWEEKPCGNVDWQATLKSNNDHPLLYAEFGAGNQVTLILGGVHPDELTPIPITFRLARHLKAHPEIYTGKGIKIIIAPLVNPDGFLRNVAARTNANGVDLNRNFFTQDWYELSKKRWQQNRQRNLRLFPGYFPNSEVETLFQISLIDRYQPLKIISLHAPLRFLDYDGPGDRELYKLSETERTAKQLVHEISSKSKNYRVVDYSFYPGSLGNYAGYERKIPTITLELGTTDPSKLGAHWEQFLPGLLQSIRYRIKSRLREHVDSVFYMRFKDHLSYIFDK